MRATAVILFSLVASAIATPEVTTLDNGLVVITEEMGYTRSVVVVVQYRVGARNETDEIAGISHFTEHMLFNGTPSMPDTRFWQIVQKNGGMANGGTGRDQTTYFLKFPADRLEEALAIESDRMRNCPMDSAVVADEIGVVLDEWRLGEDSPDNALWQRMAETMHPAHPYGRPVIGTGETISAYTAESVKEYYDTWYQPGNAVLVIVGNIDTGRTLELVEQYFGPIPGSGIPGLALPDDPPLDGPVREELVFPADATRLMISVRGCEMVSPDMAPLSFIAAYLTSGRTSWLENNLVLTGLASSAWASISWSVDPDAFSIGVILQEGVSADSVEILIQNELQRLSTELLDPELMEGIKQRYAASEILSSDDPLSVAFIRARNWNMAGDPLYHSRFLEAIASLTPQDVRNTAQKYFIPARTAVAVLTPGGEAPAASPDPDPHRELVPPDDLEWDGLSVTPADLAVPDRSVSDGVSRFTLENGVTLLVRDDHTFPIIEIMFAFPMGARRTTPDMAGLAALTGETMLGGTDELERLSFHRRLEDIGAGTWLTTGDAFAIGNTYGLSESAEMLFLSTSDLLIRPAMREDDFIAARERMIGRVRTGREQPMGRVFSEADLALEGAGSAYVTTEETLGGISIDDILGFHRACVRPSETVIAVVGDITPERALALTERYFLTWAEPAVPVPSLAEYSFRNVPGDTLVAVMPGRIQAATAVMCSAPGLDSPDEPAFAMAARILGSGISSRLGSYIREQQGLAYSVWGGTNSLSSGMRKTARFMAMYSTGASMNARALQSTVNECQRLASDGVEEMELLLEQSRAVGAHALGYDTYGDLARYLAVTEAMGLPLNRDIERLRQITALTTSQVREAAAKYFTGNWFVYTAGGIGEDMEPLDQ
ncbi:MAG: pitrilysin family protein [Candidatus Fermentibacteraceae bacterium]